MLSIGQVVALVVVIGGLTFGASERLRQTE
jgi:hypothetical protein